MLPASAAAQPEPAAPFTLDGPSPDIVAVSGLSVARDGTGGLVYLKRVAGVDHVFVSRLVGGTFQPAVQVDATLPAASSQPVIAAGNGGLLVVAFVNGGGLYAVRAPAGTGAFGALTGLFAGAANPSLQMTTLGKAYVAFTAAGSGGHDVRAAYFNNGRWALEPTPLDANAADDAGAGSGRPAVAAAGDGVAIVAWGESGHIYARRVWRASPSVALAQADPASVGGAREVSADKPSVASGGDSSYAVVAFRETFSSGFSTQTRVLTSRLRAGTFDPTTQPDGLSASSGSQADQPALVVNEYGRGWVTSTHTDSHAVFAGHLTTNGVLTGVVRVDSLQSVSPPFAVPATAGLASTLIAWQRDPGLGGAPEIRVRYAGDGSDLGPELVLSNPAQGATDAADGLVAGGDSRGDAAIAWMQGAPAQRQIVVAQMYQPPGRFAAAVGSRYVRSRQPTLTWKPARGQWGPIRYAVAVDGVFVGQTYSTSIRVPVPLADGPHSWSVLATNPPGLTSTMSPARVWVDTVAPTATLSLSGKRLVGVSVHAFVRYADRPPAQPGARASGVLRVRINWGDRTRSKIAHRASHAYRRPGRYKITVTVSDRAGNVHRIKRMIRILAGSG